MSLTNFAHAFEDLKNELRTSGSTIEQLAQEIAADYPGVNPVALVNRFNETFPNGLPHNDLEKAKELEKRAAQEKAKKHQEEVEAILDFFSAPVHVRRGLVRPAVKEDLLRALASWPSHYQTRDGRKVIGNTIGGLVQELRSKGARVSTGFDHYEVSRLGVEVVEAQYIGGVRPTGKFVKVAILPDFPGIENSPLSFEQALKEALEHVQYMTERTGERFPLEEALGSVIAASIEHAQG